MKNLSEFRTELLADPETKAGYDALEGEYMEQARVLRQEEARALVDREARRYLGISGDEFAHAWDAGKFDDDPDQADVMYLAMLLPLIR